MSVSYFVRYEGTPSDLREFLRHYRERHVPILARWPGMRRIVLHTNIALEDRFDVVRGSAYLMAQMEFDSQAQLEAAFASAERAEARRDFERFPRFEGAVVHQAMASDEVWRKP